MTEKECIRDNTMDQLIMLADEHQDADEYVAGSYEWDDGACAIGCTVRDAIKIGILPQDTYPGNRRALARALDVHVGILRWMDRIFERLPGADKPGFTPAALRGIKAAHERKAGFDTILRAGARLTIARAGKRIGDGDEPWRVECRRVVDMAVEALRARWLTEAEAARAAETVWAVEAALVMWDAETAKDTEAAEAAEFHQQVVDLLGLLNGEVEA